MMMMMIDDDDVNAEAQKLPPSYPQRVDFLTKVHRSSHFVFMALKEIRAWTDLLENSTTSFRTFTTHDNEVSKLILLLIFNRQRIR